MAMGIWPWLQQPHWYLQVFHYSRGAERQGQIYWTIHLQWGNALIHDKQNPLRGPTLINLYSGNKQIWMYWEMRRWKKQQIKNFMCPRVYLVMLILNQVVSMSFLEREKAQGCHQSGPVFRVALSKLWPSWSLRTLNIPQHPEMKHKPVSSLPWTFWGFRASSVHRQSRHLGTAGCGSTCRGTRPTWGWGQC